MSKEIEERLSKVVKKLVIINTQETTIYRRFDGNLQPMAGSIFSQNL